MCRLFRMFFAIAMLNLLFPVFQVASNEILRDTIPQIAVTGTPASIHTNLLPASVTIVNREQLERGGQTYALAGLNGIVPGLFVTERGMQGFGVSTGGAGQLSLRGIGGSPTTGVLVMLDGIPQFMGLFGHPLADMYQTSQVERIEVIRGPSSVLYGSNAMGGVVNILTTQNKKMGLSGEANLQYGSFNSSDFNFTTRYGRKTWDLLAGITKNKTGGHRPFSDFNQTGGYFKVAFHPTTRFRAYSDLNLSKFRATDPGPDTLNAKHGATMDIKRGNWNFSMDHSFEHFSGTIKLFRNFGKHAFSDGFHSEDAENGMIIKETYTPASNTLIHAGADIIQYGGNAYNALNIRLVDTTVYDLGIYGFVQQRLFSTVLVNAGLRLQHNSQYGNQWIPSSGVSWQIHKNLVWKAGAGKGFRSPSVRELFLFNHNPELRPERLTSYETGLSGSFSPCDIRYELTTFYLKATDKIAAGAMGKLYNLQSVENKGVEFSCFASPDQYTRINFQYTFIDAKNSCFGTPRNHLAFQITENRNVIQLTAGIRWVEQLCTSVLKPAPGDYQTFTLLQAGVAYKGLKNTILKVDGNNLLNQQYETIRYYTMPGATIRGGITYIF